MDQLSSILAKLAFGLDLFGLRREAEGVRHIRSQNPVTVEHFLGHTIERDEQAERMGRWNSIMIHGPLLSLQSPINRFELKGIKEKIEKRHRAFEYLLKSLPPGTQKLIGKDEISLVLPNDLRITFAWGKVEADATYNSQSKALAAAIRGKEPTPELLNLIFQKAPRIAPEEVPTMVPVHPEPEPGKELPFATDTQVRQWAIQLANSHRVAVPCDRIACPDLEDPNNKELQDLQARFRTIMYPLLRNKPTLAAKATREGGYLVLTLFDRTDNLPRPIGIEKGSRIERWVRVRNMDRNPLRTDEQIESGKRQDLEDIASYLSRFKHRKEEVAATSEVDEHFRWKTAPGKFFAIVLEGVPDLIFNKDANSDNDWWTGRKVPFKKPESSWVKKDRNEAFIVPERAGIVEIWVGDAYKKQGEALEAAGWPVRFRWEEMTQDTRSKGEAALERLHIPWSPKPIYKGEPLEVFFKLVPLKPGRGRGQKVFMTGEIADWIERNHGAFIGSADTLWNKYTCVFVGFPAKPEPFPTGSGFDDVAALPVASLPKITERKLPDWFASKAKGECAPGALRARVTRRRQPLTFVGERKDKVMTTDEGMRLLLEYLSQPLCGKVPRKVACKAPPFSSRDKRSPVRQQVPSRTTYATSGRPARNPADPLILPHPGMGPMTVRITRQDRNRRCACRFAPHSRHPHIDGDDMTRPPGSRSELSDPAAWFDEL